MNQVKMLKTYQTIEPKWGVFGANITNRFKAEFMQNRQKGKNITKPTEAKPLTDFHRLQNQSYLQNQNYKTNSLDKKRIFNALFTKRVRSIHGIKTDVSSFSASGEG